MQLSVFTDSMYLMTPPLTQALAAEIRAEIGRKKITVSGLADHMGIHRSTASELVNGKADPSIIQLQAIAEYIGRDLLSLMTTATVNAVAA